MERVMEMVMVIEMLVEMVMILRHGGVFWFPALHQEAGESLHEVSQHLI